MTEPTVTLGAGEGETPGPAHAIFEDFKRLAASGEAPDIDELCRKHPEAAAELRERYAAWKVFGGSGGEGGFLHRPSSNQEGWRPTSTGYRAGERIGEYELVRPIGEGGMGAVWEARQKELGRTVALKLIHPERSSERAIEFFRREGRAAARLHHDALVSVYDAGEADGVHYLAQELVEGECTFYDFLHDIGSRRVLPEEYYPRIATFFAEITDAMQVAHDAGVIHRDLKPQNVLVTTGDRPKVTDFGLARIQDEMAISMTGEFAGTYYYMSPEQVTAKRAGIDHRTDVFSLGVMLYEAITLSRPFEGDSNQQVANKLLFEDPPPPQEIRSKVPEELGLIALKALEKSPDHRYQSMRELGDELRRFLEGKPILTRQPGAWRRARRWTRKHPTATAVTGISVVAAAITLTLALVNLSQARALAQANDDLVLEREQLDQLNDELHTEREHLQAANRELEDARIEAVRLARQDRERLQQVMQLSALRDLERLNREASVLWPAVPERIPEYERWLEEANALLSGLDGFRSVRDELRRRARSATPEELALDRAEHPRAAELRSAEARIAEIETEIGALLDAGTSGSPLRAKEALLEAAQNQADQLDRAIGALWRWRFDSDEDAWWHEELTGLIGGLEAWSDLQTGLAGTGISDEHGWGIERRLAFARSLERPRDDFNWEECAASLLADERFAGFELRPQIGLVPLLQSARTGLWEFWHMPSGERPRGGSDGDWVVTPESGMVLVLLPGGTTWHGAQREAGQNHDARAEPDEGPVRRVRLEPFFISKYEMTQGQWKRITNRNPSIYGPGGERAWNASGRSIDETHPVEMVTWTDCERVLGRLGLQMPTEEQWEYACRAGTTTPYWTGATPESLEGSANFADARMGQFVALDFETDVDDGFAVHAPVNLFLPNPFGLHHVHGNVWEWCLTGEGTKEFGDPFQRVVRGGPYNRKREALRSANRLATMLNTAISNIGVRPARSVE